MQSSIIACAQQAGHAELELLTLTADTSPDKLALRGRLGMQSWGSMELGNGAATSAAMAEAGFAGAPQPAGGAAPAFAWPGGMPPAWPAWPAPAHAAAPHGKAGAGGPEASRTTGSSMLSGGSGASALTVGVAQLGSWRPSHSVDTAG